MYNVKLYFYISRELELTSDAAFEFDHKFKAISFANTMKHEPIMTAIRVTDADNEIIYDWER